MGKGYGYTSLRRMSLLDFRLPKGFQYKLVCLIREPDFLRDMIQLELIYTNI